jgi:NitT/TauT family transport system substrate-binding protein
MMPCRALTALFFLVFIAVGPSACRPAPVGARVRLGFFLTLTHAAALVGLERGELARAVAPAPLESKAFTAGPEAIEALFAGSLDACYVGPIPALNGYLRSDGRALAIVAGAAVGGAALVVRREARIGGPESLRGKRLATPQLANTQDVTLRLYLRAHGLDTTDRGGDVLVLPLTGADILSLMQRGELDGAWVPEPWVTRLIHQAGGRILVADRDAPSALLVMSRAFLHGRPDLAQRLAAAHARTIDWIHAHPDEARALAAQAIQKRGGKPLPPDQLAEAWQRVRIRAELPIAPLVELAEGARALGYLPPGDPRPAIAPRWLATDGSRP